MSKHLTVAGQNMVNELKRRAEVWGIQQEALLDELIRETYQSYNRALTPKFPWIAVRTLRRELKLGGIILPEAQNKTALEGVVLAVWHPFTPCRVSLEKAWAQFVERAGVFQPSPEFSGAAKYQLFLEKYFGSLAKFFNVNLTSTPGWQHQEQIKSELKPGDHVLFPAWAGMPIDGYDPKYYRFVKECNWAVDKEGGIFATVDYTRAEEAIVTKVAAHLADYDGAEPGPMAETLLRQFIVVDRDEDSATLSGR